MTSGRTVELSSFKGNLNEFANFCKAFWSVNCKRQITLYIYWRLVINLCFLADNGSVFLTLLIIETILGGKDVACRKLDVRS